MKWIEIDGSQGEGGGQILRSALSLSMITAQPVKLTNIRAGRKKPGLMRQHLTAVLASQQICEAEVEGAELSSTSLCFKPGKIRAGDYHFDLGSAGSCSLVLQTLLPALWMADSVSTVSLTGGTHNPLSPSITFIQQVWLPLLTKMGIDTSLTLKRYGFAPAGGGEVCARINPVTHWTSLSLLSRGKLVKRNAEAVYAGIPSHVARRELAVVEQLLGWQAQEVRVKPLSQMQGPGNILMLSVEFEHVKELFCEHGMRSVSAEKVATKACRALNVYLASQAAVGEYLADQLLLPMSLAGLGSFTTHVISEHFQTNIDIIRRFLDVEIVVTPINEYYRVRVERKS